MCVYSGNVARTRQAKLNETVQLTQFGYATGFASPSDPGCAVCIAPGAQLELHHIPLALQQELQINTVEVVTLERCSDLERDIILFANGSKRFLSKFWVDPNQPMTARVLSLRRLAAMPLNSITPEPEEDGNPPFEAPQPWSAEFDRQSDEEFVTA